MPTAVASRKNSGGASPRRSARLLITGSRANSQRLTPSTGAHEDSVRRALDSPNTSLAESAVGIASLRGFDLSRIHIHAGPEAERSAARLNADTYATGNHIIFGEQQFNPSSDAGRSLLRHELTHVAQQGTVEPDHIGEIAPTYSTSEADAERAASGGPVATSHVVPGTIQRKIAMRDVGRGEQSGFKRVPELIDRLNAVSTGLTFALNGSDLTYTEKADGKLSNFDTQMKGFIDEAAVIPLRFTNRHGLLGDRKNGYNTSVTEDAWSSGYVDIDDLLASSELGMQEVLVHFLRERTATKNYAQRIGSESLVTGDDTPEHIAHQKEFDNAHSQGIQAETDVLRDFFSDPTIRLTDHDSGGDVFRRYRNGRGDTIRTRLRAGRGKEAGVDAILVEVVTKDKKVHTPEEYLALIASSGPAATAPASGSAASPP